MKRRQSNKIFKAWLDDHMLNWDRQTLDVVRKMWKRDTLRSLRRFEKFMAHNWCVPKVGDKP